MFLPETLSCHDLRHTFCTRMNESNMNRKAIQSVMGHRDIRTTFDTYTESQDTLVFYTKCKGRRVYDFLSLKGSASERAIPMLEVVMETLIEEKQNQENKSTNNAIELNGKERLIFTTRDGGFRTQDGANRKLKSISKTYNDREVTQAKKECRKPVLLPENLNCTVLRNSLCARIVESLKKATIEDAGRKSVKEVG